MTKAKNLQGWRASEDVALIEEFLVGGNWAKATALRLHETVTRHAAFARARRMHLGECSPEELRRLLDDARRKAVIDEDRGLIAASPLPLSPPSPPLCPRNRIDPRYGPPPSCAELRRRAEREGRPYWPATGFGVPTLRSGEGV